MIRAEQTVKPQTNTRASSLDSFVDLNHSERAIRISPICALVNDCNREMRCAAENITLRLQDDAASAKVPSTAIAPNSNAGFCVDGFERRPWKSTEPVRKIVNGVFASANLQAFGPHAFRHMLARHAAKTCTSVAEIVATSQNLGHTDVLTTLRSYGQISRERQRALITGESADDGPED